MAVIWDQNKICRLHGVPHTTPCPGEAQPKKPQPPAPQYVDVVTESTDAAGRKTNGRGKLVKK